MLIALDVVQHEDEPGALGKPRDGRLEIERVATPDRRRRRRAFESFRFRGGHDSILSPPRGALLAEEDVHGQSMEPGGEGALTPKGGEPLPCPDEDILGEIGGGGGIACEAEAEGVDAADMGTIEGAEGLFVSRLGQANELRHQPGPSGGGGGRDQRGEEATIGGKRTRRHVRLMPPAPEGFDQAGVAAFCSLKRAQKKTAAASPISDTTRQSAA